MFKGEDLLKVSKKELRRIRGNEIAMIFQDPMTSLNPVLKIGAQIGEAIKTHHKDLKDGEIKERAIELLDLVGIPNPDRRYEQYPHEFSGGMRQRAMIAMCIANDHRGPDRRRADDRARRDDPGPGPPGAQEGPGRDARRDDPDHARPRR